MAENGIAYEQVVLSDSDYDSDVGGWDLHPNENVLPDAMYDPFNIPNVEPSWTGTGIKLPHCLTVDIVKRLPVETWRDVFSHARGCPKFGYKKGVAHFARSGLLALAEVSKGWHEFMTLYYTQMVHAAVGRHDLECDYKVFLDAGINMHKTLMDPVWHSIMVNPAAAKVLEDHEFCISPKFGLIETDADAMKVCGEANQVERLYEHQRVEDDVFDDVNFSDIEWTDEVIKKLKFYRKKFDEVEIYQTPCGVFETRHYHSNISWTRVKNTLGPYTKGPYSFLNHPSATECPLIRFVLDVPPLKLRESNKRKMDMWARPNWYNYSAKYRMMTRRSPRLAENPGVVLIVD